MRGETNETVNEDEGSQSANESTSESVEEMSSGGEDFSEKENGLRSDKKDTLTGNKVVLLACQIS